MNVLHSYLMDTYFSVKCLNREAFESSGLKAGVGGALGIQIGGDYVIKVVHTTGGLSKEVSQVAVRRAGRIL